jgi:hypothetical protein
MKKFFRVFYSQIFNSFFPVLVIAILLKLADSNKTASIFLLLNFSNIYLLFSDYSSNTILLKDAMQAGGISRNNVPHRIVEDIKSYLGMKFIMLGIGFFVWIAFCCIIPQLHKNLLSNIFAYTFIIGYNLNFYWLYMCSSKEYFFIISNFVSRLFLLLLLVLFIFYHLDFFWLMPVTGLGTIIITLVTFRRFCNVYGIEITVTNDMMTDASQIIKRDWPLVANSFLAVSPTTCLSIFVGFIKNSSHVLVYAFAEKIFMAIRALLAVFGNAFYPIVCQEGSIYTKKSKKILLLFYAAVLGGCIGTYLLSPFIFGYLKQPESFNNLFTKCLVYFLFAVVAISINTRFFLQLLVSNHFNDAKNFIWLVVATILILGVFILNIYLDNSVISVVKSVLIAETIIALTFIGLNYFTRSKITR